MQNWSNELEGLTVVVREMVGVVQALARARSMWNRKHFYLRWSGQAIENSLGVRVTTHTDKSRNEEAKSEHKVTRWQREEGLREVQQDTCPSQKAGGFARRNVLEATVEYKERASSLPAEGQVVPISEVSSTWEIAREAESWGPARFHLEKVTGNKHSRNPWRLKGNLMTTSRRSRGHSGRLILFLFLLVGQGEN